MMNIWSTSDLITNCITRINNSVYNFRGVSYKLIKLKLTKPSPRAMLRKFEIANYVVVVGLLSTHRAKPNRYDRLAIISGSFQVIAFAFWLSFLHLDKIN